MNDIETTSKSTRLLTVRQNLGFVRSKFLQIWGNKHEGSGDSLLKQATSINMWSWAGSIIFFAFALSHISKLVTVLAVKPVIIPVTAFVMAMVGDFDITKLMQTASENVGIALVVTGILTLFLFTQNIYKSALFLQSLHPDHKQYRSHALASIVTPISTVAILYQLMQWGFFFKFSTLIYSIFAIALADSASSVLVKLQDVMKSGSFDLNVLKTVAENVTLGLRIAIVVILGLYIAFVATMYQLTYKVLLFMFQKFRNTSLKIWNFIVLYKKPISIVTVVMCVMAGCASKLYFDTGSRLSKISCSYGTTHAVFSNNVVLIAKDGTGKCFGDLEKSLRVSDEYEIDGEKYRRVSILMPAKAKAKEKDGKEYEYDTEKHVPLDNFFWMRAPKDFEEKGLTSATIKKAVEAHKRRDELVEVRKAQTEDARKIGR